MAASRLSDSQKSELVERYRAGDATASLAKAYGCSPNTVTRTVKTLLSEKDYVAVKASRAQRGAISKPLSIVGEATVNDPSESSSSTLNSFDEVNLEEGKVDGLALDDEAVGVLALDDADDFGDDPEEDSSEEGDLEADMGDLPESEVFRELVPLVADSVAFSDRPTVKCEPLLPGLLPSSVYMLVDKTVELDARPLKEFSELGLLADDDKDRRALCLFANPRSAKRQCGRSQRVIKVPDTSVFELTISYLLARGITRLVLEGSLIALDSQAPSV
ncbi:helix-turn-helix domain-containing protein [Prochlorococcus sp. MIT 1201]|uniref:helix-turn-helix domain-containing protein n=1 Tax=Prochlorococcus sp. MIT 1201 TaxID=3082535 RepID=UPI0039A74E2B